MSYEPDPDRGIREQLLRLARAAGAEAADVVAMRAQTLDVSVRKGALEDAARAESFGVGLRVFKGKRQAYGSSADTSPEGLQRLAEQVSAMCGAVPEDPFTRLAEPAEMARGWIIPDLYDAAPALSVAQLGDLARAAEDAALAQSGITNSDGAGAGQSVHWIGLSTSTGFSGGYAHGGTHVSLGVIAGKGDGMETDHASAQATYATDLEKPESVGLRAATRTLARLGARPGKTGAFPVVFDRRIAASLLRTLSRAISGPRQAKGTSFWQERIGTAVCASAITVIDDPLKPRGLRSVPFDAESLPVARRAMVENGVLNGLYLDLRSAGRLGLTPSGHASRGLSSPPGPNPSNLWIAAGTVTRDDMIAGIDEGFLVTELMGASISLSTGDYSRGASGFWIRGGKVVHPVAEMTIAGNLKDMFLNMVPADDLEFRDGVDSPSLLVMGMTVATR
ncbi:MAG: TldD/PmbA family protein [Rhodospirillales bacterium]|nr:TldD/PmbA family protein [Rhodospirillales bacterium]USO08316.1 MAG: TldD/PmbA family protein [Rhodospirillales bacterium]